MTDPVKTYLHELARIRSSGAAVKETSYYSTLSNLLNEVGKQLKPRVTCIMPIADQGAGFPDGGLFTEEQLRKDLKEAICGQLPARGVIEVKGTGDDAWVTAEGKQVSKYWGKYNQVLVTNYRDFLLVGMDTDGKPVKLESFRIAKSENAFWLLAATPRKAAQELGDRLTDFLKRIMLHSAPLREPEDVAWFLASYAREAKARLEQHSDLPFLQSVREALEESLGLEFEGSTGDHFFRSTLVQTLFYGVFSAWVLWSEEHQPSEGQARFDWKSAAWSLHLPMVRELFEQIAKPTTLGPFAIAEVLDWAEMVLSRVDRTSFFQKFEESDAVQYFYEPFLAAFDPELQKAVGVWYTPPEIVKYMVARVDTVLREELGIRDGFADPRVYVLDPANGTGSYIVEVLKRIALTLNEKGGDALVASDVKRAAIERVFGFEILPAPFVVAHLQIARFLRSQGTPISESAGERVSVYLTNALTGWEASKQPLKRLMFPELEKEREESDQVKRTKPILVILGNPPYNAFAGVSPAEEDGLVEIYKEGLISQWGIKKFNLDDLYVRFFRLAERRIAEQTGRGVICYITNFSYLGDPSFVVMRRRWLNEFDKMWFDCMNGSSRETGKLTPDGKPDPSVFSTKYNREGIRVGTAIGLLVRKSNQPGNPAAYFRNFWGVSKLKELLSNLDLEKADHPYQVANPIAENRYSFRPSLAPAHYLTWPTALDLCMVPPLNGPVERRGNALISLDKAKLEIVRDYLNPSNSDDQVRALAPRLMRSSGEFKAEAARKQLLKRAVQYDSKKVARYPFKPFDVRLAYLDGDIQPLFSRPSPDLLSLRAIPHNVFFITRDTADKYPEGSPFYYSSLVCDYDCISGHARHIPLWIASALTLKFKASAETSVEKGEVNGAVIRRSDAPVANLSRSARNYLSSLGLPNPDSDAASAELLWMHAIAIGYSPRYLQENADGIRVGWPRLPLPRSQELLRESARLGRQVASFLDTEIPSNVDLHKVAIISSVDEHALNPKTDLLVTAGWGHGVDVTMPGKGKIIERDYSQEEFEEIRKLGHKLGLTPEECRAQLGDTTCDIFLNEVAFWKNVPNSVWDYTLGGYQVLKKWLSYRESGVLGRSMTTEEARELTDIAWRITAILLLGPTLNANYTHVCNDSYSWPVETR
jgi:hypothetical protein